MSKIYCVHCSFPNVYSTVCPQQCVQCGKKVDDLKVFGAVENTHSDTKNKFASSKRKISSKEIEEDIDHELEEVELQMPAKLDVEIIRDNREGKITLGDLAKQNKTHFKRDIPQNIDINKETWQQMAGNNKRTIEIADGDGED